MGNFWKEYVEYLRDNPEGYWFKRRLYGWGWVPATREGWVVIGAFIALFILNLIYSDMESDEGILTGFLPRMVLLIFLLVLVSWKTGESPKWMWGPPKKGE